MEDRLEDRLERLEERVAALQRENQELRADLARVQAQVSGYPASGETETASGRSTAGAVLGAPSSAGAARKRDVARLIRQFRLRSRYSAILLALSVALVPLLVWTVSRQNAFWSAVVGAVNVVVFYFVGPGAYHLLMEGLVRAVPGILLGHTTRIAVDKIRNRRPH